MAWKVDDRIRETSATTGAGTYALDGAPTGFKPFSGLGANVYTFAFVTNDTDWETGLYQVLAGNQLARATCYASSNAGAFVNWGVNSGTKKLRCGLPAKDAAPRRLALSVAGGAGTTVLTMDQQLNDQLELTGALTGNRIIEVDGSFPWSWDVYNNTSGAFTLTFRATGQTGVVIGQGKRVHVLCDATDVRPGLTQVPGSLDVQNNITVTGNANITDSANANRVSNLQNSSAGASAFVGWDILSDTVSLSARAHSSTFNSFTYAGIASAGYAVFWGDTLSGAGPQGMIIGLSTNKPVIVASNNGEVARFTAGGITTGAATVATGYTNNGDLTLPSGGGVRAKNVPKAWVNFNGTGTVAINDSFNVTSITDNGVGNFTVNPTNAIGNGNYASHVTVNQGGGGISLHGGGPLTSGTHSTTALQVMTQEGTVNSDYPDVSVTILGV